MKFCLLFALYNSIAFATTIAAAASSVQDSNLVVVAIGGEDNALRSKLVRQEEQYMRPARRQNKRPPSPYHSLATVEIYSLNTNQRLPNGANCSQPIAAFGSVTYNSNLVYLAGGLNDTPPYKPISEFHAYDVDKNQWQYDLPPLPQNTSVNSLVILNNTLYELIGDFAKNKLTINVYTMALPATANSVWQKLNTELPVLQFLPSCLTTVGNTIVMAEFGFVVTSTDGGQSWTSYDPSGELRPASDYSVCSAVGTDAFISVGALGGDDAYQAWLYNLTTNVWRQLSNMNAAHAVPGVVTLPDQKQVLVCGGFGANYGSNATNTCEIYDVGSNTWSMAGFNLTENRGEFGLHLLSRASLEWP